jgi:hypothetical protein
MMRKDGIGLVCRMILDGFSDPREAGFGIDQDVTIRTQARNWYK